MEIVRPGRFPECEKCLVITGEVQELTRQVGAKLRFLGRRFDSVTVRKANFYCQDVILRPTRKEVVSEDFIDLVDGEETTKVRIYARHGHFECPALKSSE